MQLKCMFDRIQNRVFILYWIYLSLQVKVTEIFDVTHTNDEDGPVTLTNTFNKQVEFEDDWDESLWSQRPTDNGTLFISRYCSYLKPFLLLMF